MLRFARGLPLAVLAFAVGCSGDDGSIASTTAIAPGAECPAGGTRLAFGVDKNGNKKLDDNEVDGTPQVICSSGTAFAALTSVSDVPSGDSHCRGGGTRLDVGLDNGDGGGTVGNGVLEPGEIDSSQYNCTGTANESSLAAPDGTAGTATINLAGGSSTANSGADGGGFDAYADDGTFGGHIKVFKTGVADASFTVPDATLALGSHPWTVSGSVTLKNVADTASLANGDYYTLGSNDAVLQWNGTDGVTVTGISVSAGATFTIASYNSSNSRIYLPASFISAGIVTTPVTGLTHASLQIRASSIATMAGASFALDGADGSGVAGGSGATFDLEASYGLYNRASINTSGGDGTSGGLGGDVTLRAGDDGAASIYNTGAIDTHGGNGSSDAGGQGGPVNIYTDSDGSAYNSGALTTFGGNGTGAGVGGRGGEIGLGNDDAGEVKNSGAVNTHGGNAGATCSGPCGGRGGGIDFYVDGGGLSHSAQIDTHGGASSAGTAGQGGAVGFYSYPGNSPSGSYVAAGTIRISGAIDAHGGSGATGIRGGNFEAEVDPYYVESGAEVQLLGYATINTTGGNGSTSGGNGGSVSAYHNGPFYSYNGSSNGPSGSVVFAVDVVSNGGTGAAGQGGSGGGLSLYTQTSALFSNSLERVVFTGTYTANGGSGTTSGGTGGEVYIAANDGATISGAVTTNGGSGTSSYGGSAGQVQVSVSADTTFSSVFIANGGNGTNGGSGGGLTLTAKAAHLSGSVTANGGNGSSSDGGNGGYCLIASTNAVTDHSTTFSVTGGTGTPAGQSGYVTIDGIVITSP